jgi:hypothetical protein
MVADTYNPTSQETETGVLKFMASLGYKASVTWVTE